MSAIACVLFEAAALKTDIVFWRHELHVGWLLAGRLMFSGRKYTYESVGEDTLVMASAKQYELVFAFLRHVAE